MIFRNFRGVENSFIKIGRSSDCELVVNDGLLSRYHCSISYDSSSTAWIIHDGLYSQGEHKLSTNGTWIYLKEEVELTEGLIFKANHTLFRVGAYFK